MAISVGSGAGAVAGPSGTKTRGEESGYSIVELVAVVATIIVILACALPQVYVSLTDYRLHGDASEISGYLNVERMTASSQDAPYSLDVNAASYAIEQLTPLTYNPLSQPSTTAYTSQNPVVYNFGTQYFAPGDTVTNCRSQVQGVTVYPIPVTGDPGTCGAPFKVYFNTRGLPVDSNGNALASGGMAIYLTNTKGLVDAVTVSAGGAVEVWNWNSNSSTWSAR
jgi:hypothetical protein